MNNKLRTITLASTAVLTLGLTAPQASAATDTWNPITSIDDAFSDVWGPLEMPLQMLAMLPLSTIVLSSCIAGSPSCT